MRLLQLKDNGEFSLTNNVHNNIPPYAILSHTWGRDDEEVNFEDLEKGSGRTKAGYQKLQFCSEQAARDGLHYFWIDTCCIDKSSSAELQESINSMFKWYRDAHKCYVYLADVSTGQDNPSGQSWRPAFRESRWFTRGWTLQELVAPRSVEFFSSNGQRIGDKRSLEQELHDITGIAVLALQGSPLSGFSVEERMSWSKGRETTREEDKAYSLLGIFDVHMPLIYSEGSENAFRRLQEEIAKRRQKRLLDELSIISEDTASFTKRSRTAHNHASSVLTRRDKHSVHQVPDIASEHSLHDEAQEEPPLRAINGIGGKTKKSLIDQLHFIRIDERLTTLTAAQGTTCRWFLSKPEYASWQDQAQQQNHGGFLWIKGNPGTGKSTLMKFLFENAKLNAKDSSCLTLSFFFLARGTVEEKSTSGLYRSLLHQLFDKAPELTDSLEWLTADGAKVIERNGWGEETLKQTLSHAIRKLGYRSLTIFIDALDECDQNQVVNMVCFLEGLCDHAVEAQVRLQICLSSRHYPTVVIQKGIEVTLEDETGHTEDIKQYIQSKLRIGNLKQAESLRSEILKISSRVFLWVALVIDILNSEYSNNLGSMKQLRARLHEIPPKLSDLFEMILARDGDRDDAKRTKLCLKWILFAIRPLEPQELYFAIQFGLDKSCTGYWDQEDVDLNQMETFVRNSSKGLAEITPKTRDVQFIHESVRDFLVDKYEKQWSGISGNFVGDCHVLLRDCCLAQLTAPMDQIIGIPLSLPNGAKANVSRQEISQKYPFLRYSINVLQHSDSPQENGIAQEEFLSVFPLQRWVHASNACKTIVGPRYTESVSLLYVLAQLDLGNLIRIHPRGEFCFDVENEFYAMPILTALAHSSYRAIQAFLEVHIELRPKEASLRDLCKRYSENRIVPVRYLVYVKPRGRNLSSYAAEYGDEGIITFLCAVGKFEFESKDNTGRTPLSWATERSKTGTIQLLLQYGAEIESKDHAGRTPLSWATGNYDYTTVVQALLEKGADIESKDNTGQTPLSWAACYKNETILQFLLEKGADTESKDNTGRTPLSWAACYKNETVLQFLLEKGADIESKDNTGQTPLSWAAYYENETILQFLLEKGADIESKDNTGRTPLSWAAYYKNETIFQFLLEKGADIESKDNTGRTPLSWAACYKNETILQFLLEKGADPKTKDNNGQTPISWAMKVGNTVAARLLLRAGA